MRFQYPVCHRVCLMNSRLGVRVKMSRRWQDEEVSLYAETPRTDRRAMGAYRGFVPRKRPPSRWSMERPQDDAQGNLLVATYGSTLARLARTLWSLEDRLRPLQPLAQR